MKSARAICSRATSTSCSWPRICSASTSGDNGIKAGILLKLGNIEKGLGNRPWIRHSGRLNQDVVELLFLEQLLDAFDQVLPHRADRHSRC